MDISSVNTVPSIRVKHDAEYVFYELTRSICPECRKVIDTHIIADAIKARRFGYALFIATKPS